MATCREATPPPSVHKPAGSWGGGGGGDDDSELDVFAAERYFNGDDALWSARSSSSLSSAFRTGTTHDQDRSAVTATAATSSSEASWNSRSALLPDGKLLDAADIAVPTSITEAEGSGRPRGKPFPSSSHCLRRWILGVAGCGCVGGDGDESASGDELSPGEVEDDNFAGVGGEKLISEGAGELFEIKGLAVVDAEESVTVRPGNSGEFSTPPILSRATVAAPLLHEQRRRSFEMLRPIGDIGSALVPTKEGPAFTIVAGNTSGLGICRRDSSEDDMAPSEVGCVYPPSEASVAWSVVTAEGAASCNFSSAASGYYYHLNGALRHGNVRSDRRRRGRVSNGGGLLTCMGDKAVDAVRPAHSDGRNRPAAGYSVVTRRQ
ncbi:hypothetical protein PR202_ga11592 [Eleusine coracana subsp. coracana]|uniref:Uncharacterized protein n=1 Tax=Eleusine coracana subsp. coracana TaxID=191504 RepID=A0AAV5C9E5_ELECO|nr:hypothetical protein PR202_ga11592 [Eleusine coracana subsp. coracana]